MSSDTLVRAHAASVTSRPDLPPVGNTPLVPIRIRVAGRWRNVWLKLEGRNPTGSSKDRAALALLSDLEARGRLTPASIVVESTSGNLGVGLACLCRALGNAFIAVIDPKTTPENRAKMQSFGALLELVDTPDPSGGYLLSRLRRVEEICAQSARYVWTDQYGNPAHPECHRQTTAPEIDRQMHGRVPAIFVAVSTGGTLAGIGRYFRDVSPATRVIAVDAQGSVVFGGSPHPRKLTGIGSARASTFIRREHYDGHVLVTDRDAFAMCRAVADAVDLRVGGSSGAVLAACVECLAADASLTDVVCICPDAGENYRSTIFADAWLVDGGFNPAERPAVVEDITPAAAEDTGS